MINQYKITKNFHIHPIIIILVLSLSSPLSSLLLQDIHATHVSEPILSLEEGIKYENNETVSINGWVKYDNKPAPDVLVFLTLINPNGNEMFQDEVRSNSNGNFTSIINLQDNNITNGGTFTISAESQCRDEHRNICNNNSTSRTLIILN
ncbi:MAG: hypothetical protein ACE5SW_11370 [Nitrososphaeraceae archaeon]